MKNSVIDVKRVLIFLAFAFGIAWLIALVIYLTGGIANSPILVPGSTFSLAYLLTTLGYMMAPALAHILTRLVTREGWKDTFVKTNIKKGWPFWLIMWILPVALAWLGVLVFFLLLPQYYDPAMGAAQKLIDSAGESAKGMTPAGLIQAQMIQAMIIGPLINSIFTFGEEFGWRSYLLKKLIPLGGRKTVLIMGVIWGVWHWPMTLMGHNYGLNYAGYPWLGMLAMIWMCTTLGTLLSWAALQAESVWPAVIGHAMFNAIAGIGVFFVQGTPNPVLGPTPAGLIGSIPLALLAALIFLNPKALPPAVKDEA